MLCFVAESLAERGHDVTIVNLKSTKNVTDFERKINDKVKVYPVPPLPPGKGKNSWRIGFIKNVVKERKAELVVGFTSFPNMYATIVGKMLGVPSIMSERADPTRTSDGSLKSKIAKWIINRATGGVFQTKGAQAYYGRGLRRRGVVIPNPIFLDGDVPNVPFEEREKSVVSVGRLEFLQKRPDVMLEAFQIFWRSHPEYVLKIYG
ncbi:MAG: glycosyltransferase, partial [Thermoguttaceae bacterium]|nr:glycosyltransferase [Thermoguttaceae bacterium]